VIKTVFMYFYV